jgi:hypothetical protein
MTTAAEFAALAERFRTETLTTSILGTIWEDALRAVRQSTDAMPDAQDIRSKRNFYGRLIDAGGFIDAIATLLPPGCAIIYIRAKHDMPNADEWEAFATGDGVWTVMAAGPTEANARGYAAMLAWEAVTPCP